MARIALSRPVAQMCPTPRGPPHQTQLADPDATYLARAHNCDFVAGNKITVFHLGKEQLMPATVLAPFLGTKERNQALQPFVPTADEVLCR